jgi:hypothetical protein
LDIANDNDEDGKKGVEPMAGDDSPITLKETHLSKEEEIERRKGVLMRRVRMLRAECENLEQQIEHARQTRLVAADTQEKAQNNVDEMMYGCCVR